MAVIYRAKTNIRATAAFSIMVVLSLWLGCSGPGATISRGKPVSSA
jgi:hypothetical protein